MTLVEAGEIDATADAAPAAPFTAPEPAAPKSRSRPAFAGGAIA